jgi:hypothetical protein
MNIATETKSRPKRPPFSLNFLLKKFRIVQIFRKIDRQTYFQDESLSQGQQRKLKGKTSEAEG